MSNFEDLKTEQNAIVGLNQLLNTSQYPILVGQVSSSPGQRILFQGVRPWPNRRHERYTEFGLVHERTVFAQVQSLNTKVELDCSLIDEIMRQLFLRIWKVEFGLPLEMRIQQGNSDAQCRRVKVLQILYFSYPPLLRRGFLERPTSSLLLILSFEVSISAQLPHRSLFLRSKLLRLPKHLLSSSLLVGRIGEGVCSTVTCV